MNHKKQKYEETLARLKEFSGLKRGWMWNQGEEISEGVIADIVRLVDYAFKIDLWKSNCFPLVSGGVQLVFYENTNTEVEIFAEKNGTFEVTHDYKGKCVREVACLDIKEVEAEIELFKSILVK